MMKNIKLLLFALLSLAIVSCGADKEDQLNDTIKILKADCEFGAIASEGVIEISASDENVRTTSNVEWLTINRSNSKTIFFSVDENVSLSNRVAIVTLKNGSTVKEVMVYQQGAILSIPSIVKMPIKKSTFTIQYDINLDYTPSVSVTQGNDWLSVRTNNNGEIIVETKSDNMIERKGTINVRTDWSSINISVIQQGIIDKTSVFLFNGTLFSNDVIELNSDIIADLEIIENDDDWYEATFTSTGLNIKTLTQNDEDEARTSNLMLKYGDISAPILVAQSNKTYGEYIKGAWAMSFMNNLRTKNIAIKMGDKRPDLLVLSFIIVEGKDPFNIPLELDESTGILSLSPIEVALWGDEKYPIYITLYNSANSRITKRDDVSVNLVFNRDYNNPQLLFKDNGSWTTQIADGLMFAIYNTQLEYDDYYAIYPYITTFTKSTATE